MNLAQWTRSLFARKPAARKPLARHFRPELEGLTDRITPSVTANVATGVLTVKATGAATDDNLIIAPVAGFAGRFTVTGNNGTVVNTAANGVFDAVGVTSMKFDLGEGDDTLQADNLILAGGIFFRGGNGKNTFHLYGSTIGGSVSVTNLTNTTGNDFTDIQDSTINGSVTVNNGLGNANGTFKEVNILGNLSYTTASIATIPGDDIIQVSGLYVGGNIALALGNGTNKFDMNFYQGEPIEAGGSFTYTGGSGIDHLNFLTGATFGTSATINLGEGNNQAQFGTTTGPFVGTKLTVAAGGGNDSISLYNGVNGAASFKLGNGNNTFTTSGLRAGSLRLTTGAGNDTGTFNNMTVVGAATLNFGAGTNTVNLANTASSTGPSIIGGALTLTTGTGADTIQVGANGAFNVGGAAKFTLGTTALGNGNDVLHIDNSLFASSLGIVSGAGNDALHIGDAFSVGIAGRLTVNAGAGDDQLFLGTFNDPNKAVRLLVAPNLIGGAGGADIVRIFAGGNIQGPPGVVVLPTPASLLASGWEGLV